MMDLQQRIEDQERRLKRLEKYFPDKVNADKSKCKAEPANYYKISIKRKAATKRLATASRNVTMQGKVKKF